MNGPKAAKFLDDNTISASHKDLKNLPEALEKEIWSSYLVQRQWYYSKNWQISIYVDRHRDRLTNLYLKQ